MLVSYVAIRVSLTQDAKCVIKTDLESSVFIVQFSIFTQHLFF